MDTPETLIARLDALVERMSYLIDSDWPKASEALVIVNELRDAAHALSGATPADLRKALEHTTAMCRAATTWSVDDIQGLRYHALEAARDGMQVLGGLSGPAGGAPDAVGERPTGSATSESTGASSSIDCPACGETVKQVASATLSLALWQHWNWKCPGQEEVSVSPASEGEKDYKALYYDLLFAVEQKHPHETRHETARRYIREREQSSSGLEAQVSRLTDALHQRIMNIPCGPIAAHVCTMHAVDAYRLGHKDARHEAAELVLASPDREPQP